MNLSTYTPNKQAFYFRVLSMSVIGVGLLLLLGIGLILFELLSLGLAFVGTAALSLALSIANVQAMYKKRKYTLASKAIHFKTGSLFTDKETELTYKNITHVRLVKPFLECRLFGAGQIRVEAAGSSGTEVLMESLKEPELVYKELQRVMAANGFGLTYQNLRRQERPAAIAVVLEVFGAVFGTLFFLFFFFGFGGALALLVDTAPLGAIVGLGFVAVLIGIALVYVYYQDLIRRKYYIYDDVISYERGFLTRQEAFIPIENLSDSELNQTFIDKVLGLYDVVVSCQGSGSQISFKNLRNGKQVEATIDELINNKPAQQASTQTQLVDAINDNQQVTPIATTPTVTDATVRSYYRDTKRVILPYAPLLLVLWIFPPLIVFPIWSFIVAKRTEYKLGVKSVGSHFNFLSTKNIEFSRDKITGLVITRDIIDRWLNTCSVSFWSIGSGQAVKFEHIPYDEDLPQLMQAKAGIPADETLLDYQPDFTMLRMIRANLYLFISSVFLSIVTIALALFVHISFISLVIVIAFIYVITWYILLRRYRHAHLRIGQFTTKLRVGWLRQQTNYVLQENVKDITTIAYPWDSAGIVQFNVAGEQIQQSTGNQSKRRIPNHFRVGYINSEKGIKHLHDNVLDVVLDELPDKTQFKSLHKQPQNTEPLRVSRPMLSNDVFVIVALHVIVFPLILILPISLLVRIVWLRAIRYQVESNRVVRQSGIVYRSQTSIINKRIDYMKHGQRFINKLFNNGDVYIYTTGSSTAELTLRNASDYMQLHTDLNNAYES